MSIQQNFSLKETCKKRFCRSKLLVLIWDASNNLVYSNDNAENFVKGTLHGLLSPATAGQSQLNKVQADKTVTISHHFVDKTGKTRYFHSTVSKVTKANDSSGVLGYMHTLDDITTQVERKHEIEDRVLCDPLAKLFNHRHFVNVLKHKFNSNMPYSMAFFQLDIFTNKGDIKSHILYRDSIIKSLGKLCKRYGQGLCFRYDVYAFVKIIPGRYVDIALRSVEKIRCQFIDTHHSAATLFTGFASYGNRESC
jgi:GGDEF domain-containing protein